MNKHDEVIELIKEWLRQRSEDMFDEEYMILNNASDLLEQYGQALERLGDPYAFDDFSINERIDYAKQVVDDYEQ